MQQQPSASQQPIQSQNNTGPERIYSNPQPLDEYETIAMLQPSALQQSQNIAGPGQTSFNGNPQPLYYIGNPYPQQGDFQDPMKMAYSTLPMQPYPTSTMPQLYGGNYYSSSTQQVCAITYASFIALFTYSYCASRFQY